MAGDCCLTSGVTVAIFPALPLVILVLVRARYVVFFFQAEDGIRDHCVTGVQTCALPISQCGEVQGEGQGGTGGGQLRAAAQECAARVAGGVDEVHGDIALLCRRSVTCSVTCSVTSAPDIRDWPSPAARRLPRG